jgi:hypothetical protein
VGILIENAAEFPAAAQLRLNAQDVITRINTRKIDSLDDAAQMLSQTLSNPEAGATLVIETVNGFDRNWNVLDFPSLLEKELSFRPESLLAMWNLMATLIEGSLERAEASGRVYLERSLTVGRMAAPLQLNAGDGLVSIHGIPITGFPSLLSAINETKRLFEEGEITSTYFIVHRRSTNQYVRTRVFIPDESPA